MPHEDRSASFHNKFILKLVRHHVLRQQRGKWWKVGDSGCSRSRCGMNMRNKAVNKLLRLQLKAANNAWRCASTYR
jgi:malate synthase